MKALCVTAERALELREIAFPATPAAEHVLIEMEGSAINHGDITFLRMPNAAGRALAMSQHDVWGVSGAGRVSAIGARVPQAYLDKQVTVYRSIKRSEDTIGVWSERAQIHFSCCLILPDQVRALDYCGSLVNAITAYAFLEEMALESHRGVIVTAGNSATGLAMAALVRHRKVPAIFLVRNEAARASLLRAGVEHVLVADTQGFAEQLATLAQALGTTAIFEGVGGELPGLLAPLLPMNSTIYFYGFLGGTTPFALPSVLLSMKNLTLKSFSNFASATVREPERLKRALENLQPVIDNPLFRTRLGEHFTYAQIDQALAYAGAAGAKAVLVPGV
jgi:NADPH2:quinone reductase